MYKEPYRPGFHFTPPANWMNDPNGLVCYGGLCHLFFQYNPGGDTWGDMHWGHAVSKDLLHWEHRPVALASDHNGLGMVFSGSAVVDADNTSGFQDGRDPPLVAMFTHHSAQGDEVQSLAFSTDGGSNWQMYADNPVLIDTNLQDFRDPKVFRYDREECWVMALAAGSAIRFYRSPNLRDWTFLSEFGADTGAHGGVWECPDLFELPVEGGDETMWVLLVSINPGGPNGGSATQYFVGDFDGRQFVTDQAQVLWLDHGPDCYATVSWSDVPADDGRRIGIGWMSNWLYANDVPTRPWRGAMTVPREFRLIRTHVGIRLAAGPVDELQRLRRNSLLSQQNLLVSDTMRPAQNKLLPDMLELEITLGAAGAGDFVLQFENDAGQRLVFSFCLSDDALVIDRSGAASGMDGHAEFLRSAHIPLDRDSTDEWRLRLLKDRSSVELFDGDGRSLATLVYFADDGLDRLTIAPAKPADTVTIDSLEMHELADTWLNTDRAV